MYAVDKNVIVYSTPKTREWLVRNVVGVGFKETSHFLRNIGLGKDIAMLDVYILRNFKEIPCYKKISSLMAQKAYLNIENRMKAFSWKINIHNP